MLERAARASTQNVELLGYSLQRLSMGTGDLRRTAGELGLEVDSVYRLALCFPPRPSGWREDIGQIAQVTKIAADKLIALFRQLDALDALTYSSEQMLLAARAYYVAPPKSSDGSDEDDSDRGE
jgi:hypothetical protein